MLIERIWTGNAYRNYNYLVACPETGDALAIDPLDHGQCLARARAKGWRITQVLNTHEHADHTGGNAALIAATGARLIAHHKAGSRIPGVNRGVAAGDIIRVGKRVELECLDTPGHTFCHVCLLAHTEQPALFSGDTLFNAGAGNCHNGGDPLTLFHTFTQQLMRLPEATHLYPGHDYIENNLRFALSCEPDNSAAQGLLTQAQSQPPQERPPTTLAQEREVNPFMRLQSPQLIEHLRQHGLNAPAQSSEQTLAQAVFLALRELRNRW